MQVQPCLRTFSVRCYACKREVKMSTRTWEIDAKREAVDCWGACPNCAAEISEFTAQLPQEKCLGQRVTNSPCNLSKS